MLKVRVKFRKQGSMQYVGHLDILRYFQKAIRRADIKVGYSEGFSPHMIMSFAAPLGVGLTSDGEYFDIEVKEEITSQEGILRLNEVMAQGMEVTGFRRIEEDKKNNAMALVAAAKYTVRFRKSYEPETNWQSRVSEFLEQEEILIWKKTKKNEKEVNIKPYIYSMRPAENSIIMLLASGSENNLKPELVMSAFASWMGQKLEPFALCINRDEMYALKQWENGRFIPLIELGEDIL